MVGGLVHPADAPSAVFASGLKTHPEDIVPLVASS